jgi:hypothetical protein
MVHCWHTESSKPGLTISFDSTTGQIRYGITATSSSPTPVSTLQEGTPLSKYTKGTWVHVGVVHDQASNTAYLYHDGVAVKNGTVTYLWGGESMECVVGNNANAASTTTSSSSSSGTSSSGDGAGSFTGDVLWFYYWKGALNQREMASTRATGTPQHTSSSMSVVGAVSSDCTDIDECALGMHTCAEAYTCANTPGSFTCMLNEEPPDANECVLRADACPRNMLCINTLGSFACFCTNGTTHTMSFTGTNSYTMPAYTRLGRKGVSIAMWVRADAVVDRWQPLIECLPVTATDPSYFMVAFNSKNNAFKYALSDDAQSVEHSIGASRAYARVWTHVAIVHDDSSNVAVYRDGMRVKDASMAYSFSNSNVAECKIGTAALSRSVTNFVGSVRAAYVWARALDDDEVRVCVLCVCFLCLVTFCGRCMCVCMCVCAQDLLRILWGL